MNKKLWIDTALKMGFESFEIYQDVSEKKDYSWYKGSMDSFTTSHVMSTALRGIYHDRLANYATEDTGDEQMEKVLRKMIEQAESVTSEDEVFIREPEKGEEILDIHQFIIPEADKVKEVLEDVEKKILAYDPRMLMVNEVEWEEIVSKRIIANSKGMSVEDTSRIHVIVAEAAAKEGEEVKTAFDIKVVEDLDKFDTDAFVKKVCDSGLNKLGASSMKSGNYPVIFDKDAMSDLFSAFSYLYSGDLIGKGISPLRDKIGQQIFSEKITVIDDPACQESYQRANYDDEGCPTYKKNVVKDGVFELALQDSKSAARMGTKSTGNGFKGSYASAVGVSPMNCYIVPGEKSLDELMAMMGEGLVITDLAGLHAGIDAVTANFSLQCSGYLVKGGKRDRSVSLITVAANFLELMKKVEAVGSDIEWSVSADASPSIYFTEVAIAGE